MQLIGHEVMVDITIIMPVYKNISYLREAVEACLSSSRGELELIIVDDGNSKNISQAIQRIAAPYNHNIHSSKAVRIVRHQSNRGLSASRNSGLSVAKGQYVRFVDCDDLVESGSSDQLMQQLISDGSQVSIGKWIIMEKSGNLRSPRPALISLKTVINKSQLSLYRLAYFWDFTITLPIHSAVFLRSIVPAFEERLSCKEDFRFWLKLSDRNLKVSFSPLTVAVYRMHDNQMTRRKRLMWQCEMDFIGLMGSQFGLIWRVHRCLIATVAIMKRVVMESFN